jgi:hypothetical protein
VPHAAIPKFYNKFPPVESFKTFPNRYPAGRLSSLRKKKKDKLSEISLSKRKEAEGVEAGWAGNAPNVL